MGVYKWKSDARFSGNAQEVGEWLESIDERTPENIVEEAEQPDSPGHKYFTWDNSKAAAKWRMQEARLLVNAVVIVSEDNTRDSIEIPAFESVVINNQRQYESTVSVLTSDDMRAQILGDIKQSISELSRKAKMYKYIAENELSQAQYHLDMAGEAVGNTKAAAAS